MDDWLGAVQWPAMVATVVAAWLVASARQERRRIGFWVFVLSNVLWVAWGWHTRSWALVVLQFCLFAMNLRGARRNREGAPQG